VNGRVFSGRGNSIPKGGKRGGRIDKFLPFTHLSVKGYWKFF
jgi:hypothetical protein